MPAQGGNLERERIREGARSERERDIHKTRQEINAGIGANFPSKQPPESLRGFQTDTKSK